MHLTHSRKNQMALAAVCLAALMFGLEISSVPVILPTLEHVLHGGFEDMQWIMNAYTIACTTVLMAAGTLADRFGRKRMFILGIALFGIASLICGLAQSAAVLIASRFLQGMAGGAMLICLVAILSHQFQEGKERSKAFGAWGIVFGIGLGFGPIVGGMIVAVSSWQWVFLVHVLLAILTLALVIAGVEESRDPQAGKLDMAGIVTLSLAVFGLAYLITQGPEAGVSRAAAIGMTAATAASFVAFLLAEKLNPHPMFDVSVFRSRNFSGRAAWLHGHELQLLAVHDLPAALFPRRAGLRQRGRRVVLAGLHTAHAVVSAAGRAACAALRRRQGHSPGLVHDRAGLHADEARQQPGAGKLADPAPGRAAGRHRPGHHQHAGDQHHHRLGPQQPRGHGVGHRHERADDLAGGQYRADGIHPGRRDLCVSEACLSGAFDALQLRALAQRIAAGNLDAPGDAFAQLPALDASGAALHGALVHGFGWVMLYGGIGAWVLALLSLMMFAPGKRGRQAAADPAGRCA